MRRWLLFIAVVLAIVVCGFYFRDPIEAFVRTFSNTSVAAVQPTSAGDALNHGGGSDTRSETASPSGGPAVPVTVVRAKQGNVPIYLSGIGTVIAYNTVDVKTQVDGVIQSINFKEGDDVNAGDALVSIDPTPYQAQVERWQATKQKAQALLENAQNNLARAQKLAANNFATAKQIDEQTALVNEHTAGVTEADAQIKFNQYQLDNTIVRSPIDGRTGIRQVDPGNLVRTEEDTTIVRVVQLQPISVIISVPAKDLAAAGISQGLTDLPVFAYAPDGKKLLGRGKVHVVDNVVDPATGTIQLKASFPNRRYRLWPGEFTDSKIMVDERKDGVTVPADAIQRGVNGDFVWVIGPDSVAQAVDVVVKQAVGDVVLLDRGLSGGENVVVEGQYGLKVGSRVEVVPERGETDSVVSNDAVELPR